MVAFGAYLAVAARTLYVARLTDQLATQARLVGTTLLPTLAAGGGIAQVDPLVKRLGRETTARITVIAPNSVVLGDSVANPHRMENHAGRPEIIQAKASDLGTATRRSATLGQNFLYVAVPIPGTSGAVVRVAMPLNEVDAAVWRIRRDVLIAALLAAGLAAVVALVVARRIAGPLDDLRRQASAVAAGRLDTTVTPAVTQEIGEIGRAFNTMTAELRTLAAEQEQSRTRLEAMLANLRDGVVITNADGAVVRINTAAARMLGTTVDAAVGRSFVVAARDHDLAALLGDALTAGSARSATVEHQASRRVLEAAARPLIAGDERLGLVVLQDVTELRRLERVRREFVANVSHELRTPLTSIRALVETLAAGARDDPEVASDFLDRIVDETDRLTALVDDLLDLAQLESGRVDLKLMPGDTAGLLTTAVDRLRPAAARAGVTLHLELPPNLPAVRADHTRIEQVLLNLVHNAIKFTPTGGEIVVAATAAKSELHVSVRDTGVGIAADELPRLFERFYKVDKARHSAGTGLGLAIAKHIVQAHDGRIWAESEPGRGATFTFTLPLAPTPGDGTGSGRPGTDATG